MSNEIAAASSRPDGVTVENFTLRKFFEACRIHWIWFALSLVACLSVAVLYILTRQPVYERSEQILIKDQDGGGGIGDNISSAFASMGFMSSNTSVYNELISLTSPAVMGEVVERLHLDMNYTTRKGLHPQTLYGTDLPVVVSMPDLDVQQGAGFTMVLNPDGSMDLSKFYKYTVDGKQKYDKELKVGASAKACNSPVGKIMFEKNRFYSGVIDKPMKIKVGRAGLQSTIEVYSGKLKGDLVDQDAEVIELSIKDVSTQRAVDILNEVVTIYNENWVEDKNKLAKATSSFIDERLQLIQQELGEVDTDITDYKTKTMIPSIEASVLQMMQEDSELSAETLKITNQLAMASYMKQYLNDPAHKFDVIPVNVGTGSDALAAMINEYNTVLFQRNNLVASSSVNNPLVKDYDSQLAGMREGIEKTLRADMSSMEAVLRNTSGAQGRNSGKIRENPSQQKYLRNVERQQKVKEELYLYLLQKREENELGQTFTAYNTRIITPPTGGLNPVAPKKSMILFVAFFLGLGAPAVILYLVESSDTKVRGRKDLETLPLPFAGEIPRVGKKKRLKVDTGGKKKKKDTAPLAVVQEGKRDVVNEAFRVVRSNIDFMKGKGSETQVWMVTSFNPGSGKSFVSYNLGLSFAIKGKKVLLIDGDLRHGSTSMYVGSPSKGLSTYLRELTDDWHSLVKHSADNANLDVLPAGSLPPNPAELLDNGRLPELLAEAKKQYDYIFIDCPPVNIVVDTQVIDTMIDRTLFVVRAGLLERSALDELTMFYNEKRYKHMSVILNGTDTTHSGYHVYGNYESVEAAR